MVPSNFFEINLPYGIERNDNGEWTVFNRGYHRLGSNSPGTGNEKFIYTKYAYLSKNTLLKLAEGRVVYDENNEIVKIWLYDSKTKPTTNPRNWEKYSEKLKLLSKLQVKKQKWLVRL
jgi:hypothetical protein